jgi:hypothetical protein
LNAKIAYEFLFYLRAIFIEPSTKNFFIFYLIHQLSTKWIQHKVCKVYINICM